MIRHPNLGIAKLGNTSFYRNPALRLGRSRRHEMAMRSTSNPRTVRDIREGQRSDRSADGIAELAETSLGSGHVPGLGPVTCGAARLLVAH
jgi:hypothetical protein